MPFRYLLTPFGEVPYALAGLLDGDGNVGSLHFGIGFGMVHVNLGDVCPGSLGVQILEVGLKVDEGGLECDDLSR
ncbi:MAG: hypothetical protein F4103_17025 [Boseongicola sp. SB0673_bin_14]|nr:hypothetical protein [Boseongicola sp.]MYI70362.1 hypothetical protein [Boseongicola sp. SB0673_bin_14]